jgi:hypothetical protein
MHWLSPARNDLGLEAEAIRERSLVGIFVVGSKNAHVSKELNLEVF